MDPGPAFRRGPHFGSLYEDYDRGILRRGTRLVSLSQEHGVLSEALPVGTRVRILPNHSCLAVACFDAFFVVRGREVLDVWRIRRER
jgi:D-serine deaminase-like pyridoxal phosphate-dependent protein